MDVRRVRRDGGRDARMEGRMICEGIHVCMCGCMYQSPQTPGLAKNPTPFTGSRREVVRARVRQPFKCASTGGFEGFRK